MTGMRSCQRTFPGAAAAVLVGVVALLLGVTNGLQTSAAMIAAISAGTAGYLAMRR